MSDTGSSGDDTKANTMWGGRFAAGPDAIMEAINASVSYDQRMARQDIEGSRAHAAMLAATGIVDGSDVEVIREGLLTVLSEIEGGTVRVLDRAGRHPHERRGAPERDHRRAGGSSAHGSQSRNDQVATDFKLMGARSAWMRPKGGFWP